MRKTKYTVKYTTAFKKDYKRAIKRGLKIELLEQVVALLSMGEPLPDKNRDHDLSGDWVGHRECHILPDWLLIYRIEDDVLVLTLARTGSHSDLFKTALLLWNTAGRPEPAEAPAFKDVADPDTAKAAQWCVEHGLMDQKLGGRFAPDNSDPAYKTLNAYQQLVG